ncbi:NADPH-dependent FMN reductase [Sporosarcina sp. ACRSL]|uniref:NADPH-dependent FMN reductase n=1 Tax=Sporosarcina sp. ACRSL TaxID=2918215 RepID=UPI001EF5CD2A|nr:NADPH-dependent FMN reductase [Sporosarcina sp. ACRSL]MCG7344964.1 NADPH-dependent FMN reductase [Sporosarcina sp. ACRSL]
MTSAIIINGGIGKQSRLMGIQHKVERHFETKHISFNTIHVQDLPAEDLINANFTSESILQAIQLVEDAHIVVVLTPVYKASFTGVLKTFLDLLPQKALQDKKVIPLALGGSLGHLLAIEYALKPILSVLGATEILNTVYVVDKQIERLDNGTFLIEREIEVRLEEVLQQIDPLEVSLSQK